jgi:hypothetical protein
MTTLIDSLKKRATQLRPRVKSYEQIHLEPQMVGAERSFEGSAIMAPRKKACLSFARSPQSTIQEITNLDRGYTGIFASG